MEKDVIIQIKGTQVLADGQKDTMELVTQGTLKGQPGDFLLSYQESELTGLEGTTTTFHLERGQITLIREGTLDSTMVFRLGEKTYAPYNTPYGALVLGVDAQKVYTDLDEAGGNILITYLMEVEGQMVGENTFEVRVDEPTQGTIPN